MVLVTGGSGFIAGHIILKLSSQGYRARATLRLLSRRDEVKAALARGGLKDFANLEFIEADLASDKNWLAAADGAAYVIHAASPTPAVRPDDGGEMVKMAVDGALRVLKAAKASGVKRVVLTSASGAVIAGHKNHPEPFTEKDWTNLSGKIDAYQRSKTMVELAAWEFAEKENLELCAVNPTAVMGPVFGRDFSHSNQIIQSILNGKSPLLLKMAFDYVDARDVADLHLLAATRAETSGERFLAASGESLTYKEIAGILLGRFGESAKKISAKEAPDFLVKALSLFIKDLRMPATFLGQNTACSNEKAKKMLGWNPRSAREAIIATAESMIELGLIGVNV